MSYSIEILCLGEDLYPHVDRAAQTLNGVQNEFRFETPSLRLKQEGLQFSQDAYYTNEVFDFLRRYRSKAKGHRPFIIAVINGALKSVEYRNLFGSHQAEHGVAVVTLKDQARYVDLPHKFLCYYFIRYSLSFVDPELKSHKETKSCFFDKKEYKPDLRQSLTTGKLCSDCQSALEKRRIRKFRPQ
jgi:hypothetical protein